MKYTLEKLREILDADDYSSEVREWLEGCTKELQEKLEGIPEYWKGFVTVDVKEILGT